MDERTKQAMVELKRRMRTAKDLSDIWNWFHDELVTSDRFLCLGEPYEDKRLIEAIECGAQAVCGKETRLLPLIIRVAEERFCHGSIVIAGARRDDDRLGVVMFFEDLDIGLFGIMRLPLTQRTMGQLVLMRLTLLPIASPAVVVTQRAQA